MSEYYLASGGGANSSVLDRNRGAMPQDIDQAGLELLLLQGPQAPDYPSSARALYDLINEDPALLAYWRMDSLATVRDYEGNADLLANAPVTNLHANGGFETSTAQWALSGTGVPTLVRDTAQARFGVASGKMTCGAGGTHMEARFFRPTAGPADLGVVFSVSVYLWADPAMVGKTGRVYCADNGPSGSFRANRDQVLVSGWNYLKYENYVCGASDFNEIEFGCGMVNPLTGDYTYIDGAQLEAGNTAHAYVETDGAPASIGVGLSLVAGMLANDPSRSIDFDGTAWLVGGDKLRMAAKQSFTVEFVAYQNGSAGANLGVISNGELTALNDGWYVGWSVTSGNFFLGRRSAPSNIQEAGIVMPWPALERRHLMVGYDGATDTYYLYANGNLLLQQVLAALSIGGQPNLRIGTIPTLSNWVGGLDEIAVYNVAPPALLYSPMRHYQAYAYGPASLSKSMFYGADFGVGANVSSLSGQMPVSDAGGGSELSTLASALALADTGAGAELSALVAVFAGPEAGSGTDTAVVLSITLVSGSDTGSGADASALRALLTDSDSGAGADAATLLSLVSGADAGSGAELSSLAALLAGTESGSGSESGVRVALYAVSDTGAGSDNAVLNALYAVTDAGVGADTSLLVAALAGSDVGAGVDLSALVARLPGTDSGAGAEGSSLQQYFTGADTGAGADAGTVALVIAVTDAGAASEGSTLIAVLSGSETGTGAEASSLSASLPVSESGSGAESSTLTARIAVVDQNGTVTDTALATIAFTGADSGTGAQTAALVASFVLPEVGAGVELAAISKALIAASETGSGSEGASLAALLSSADTNAATLEDALVHLFRAGTDAGVGTEQLATLIRTALDSGTGADQSTMTAALSGLEAASGADVADLVATLLVVDAGIGTDTGLAFFGRLLAAIATGRLQPVLTGSVAADAQGRTEKPVGGEVIG